MSTSTGLARCAPIADHDDHDDDVVALTHGFRDDRHASAQLRVLALRPAGPRVSDAVHAWRHTDVVELDDEPDDLRLLAHLRDLDDPEPPTA